MDVESRVVHFATKVQRKSMGELCRWGGIHGHLVSKVSSSLLQREQHCSLASQWKSRHRKYVVALAHVRICGFARVPLLPDELTVYSETDIIDG
jgi:hypothetical protein